MNSEEEPNPMPPAEIDLSVPSLAGLHERRGEKWALFAPDVLSMTIAEMDFPVAPAIREAVKQVIDRSDLGYGTPASGALRSAVTGFARRRLNWEIDDTQISIVPDVMLGIVGLCQLIAGPGGSVGFATPAYPPFFRELALAGLTTVPVELDPDGAIDVAALDRALDGGIGAFVLVNPHNPTGR
jgi:cystathionine beta-lyase